MEHKRSIIGDFFTAAAGIGASLCKTFAMAVLAVSVAGASLFIAPAPAQALDVGQCGTQAAMTSHVLGKESHHIVSGMNRLVVNPDTGKARHIAEYVTATDDYKSWYMITSDQPLGTDSGRMCITLKGKDLKVNDHRKLNVSISLPSHDRQSALEKCEELQKTVKGGVGCGALEDILSDFNARLGERIAMQGTATLNGSNRDGGLITFVADPGNEKDYRALITTPEGATVVMANGENFTFTAKTLDSHSEN